MIGSYNAKNNSKKFHEHINKQKETGLSSAKPTKEQYNQSDKYD